MSFVYRFMYRLGFTPWDGDMPPELVDIITGPEALPAGRAIDLGSGKAGKAIYMAQHGWRVTAVENVPLAMREAHRRADRAGVKIDFRQADVTRLGDLGLEAGYSLFFDFGCYHGLSPAQRQAYGSGVDSLAAPGATLLLMGFTQPLPPVTRGVTEADLQAQLGGAWRPVSMRPISTGTSAMNRGSAAWFRFEHS